MTTVSEAMPATVGFIKRHRALFDECVNPDTLDSCVTLRKGAPVIQMLTAPDDFVEGSAEPWIVDILCALLRAIDQRVVVETGAFVGATAARLAVTLGEMGGGTIIACEIDEARAIATHNRLQQTALPLTVEWQVIRDDVLTWLGTQRDESIGFAWVDDDHGKAHVAAELNLLLPKMVSGGLICGHDVWGSCELHEVFEQYGGYALDLPRLGAAGGLGLLQVR